jgi:uncharacterized peroxidase-related enzyme
MPNIQVISPQDATGSLKEIYEQLQSSRGKIAAVHTIGSLNPESLSAHMNLYMTLMFNRSPLSRPQREMIGVVVSATNSCGYCVAHHREALDHFWRDRQRTDRLAADFHDAELSDTDIMLCKYARALTLTPSDPKVPKMVRQLQDHGLSDREILDATQVTAYFNFVNRVVLAHEVEIESDPGGYRYGGRNSGAGD